MNEQELRLRSLRLANDWREVYELAKWQYEEVESLMARLRGSATAEEWSRLYAIREGARALMLEALEASTQPKEAE